LDVKLWGDGPKALRDELQPVLARLLREAGATVLVRGEPDFNTIKAQIVVDLKLYKSPDSSQCAWGIDVVLYDPVQLVRDPSIRPSRGYAYHNWRMGIAACPAVESVIRDNAVEFVEQFAKAFKHENSK
jgi:hypothetical protein